MRKILTFFLAFTCTACAATPPVETTYYPTASELHMRVTRTLACDKTGKPIVATTVVPTMIHRANDDATPHTFSFADVARPWANNDITVELTSDGRLKGINASSTGQGQAIVDAAVKLIALAESGSVAAADTTAACADFTAAYGDKPLSIIIEATDRFDDQEVSFRPDWQSRAVYERFADLFGALCYQTDNLFKPKEPATTVGRASGATIHAVQPAWQTVSILVGPKGNCAEAIWKARVPVAQLGTPYELIIPAGELFGKQRFEVAFDEAGAITKLKYGADAGTEGLASLVSVAQQLDESDAEYLASLKLEADIIAAQQRLVACRADESKC